MSNITDVTEFFLSGFSEQRELQILHFLIFLAMYLAILGGNLLIITLVALSTSLHTPLYFFLVNLSIVDLGTTTVTMPKSMISALRNTTQISYSECAAQMLFFLFFISSDLFLLTVMAYDRYVAICHPLHYAHLINRESCIQLAGAAWMAGLLNAVLHTASVFSMRFCSNTIDQFFCEIPHLIKMSCSDSYLREIWALLFSLTLGFGCFVCIIMSYVKIFSTVFRMSSVENRQKAFSTCIPHLIVVTLFMGTCIFSQFMPTSNSFYNLDEMLAVIYAIVAPMMNPIIYSMRNKDIKVALWKMLYRKLPPKHRMTRVLM